MNDIDKKIIVFKNDVSSFSNLEKRYVKFLDDEKSMPFFTCHLLHLLTLKAT